MSKFSKILEIDEDARIARVEPGVRNLAISEAVSHLDLYYAPTHRHKLHVRSVGILQKIRVAFIVSNTD